MTDSVPPDPSGEPTLSAYQAVADGESPTGDVIPPAPKRVWTLYVIALAILLACAVSQIIVIAATFFLTLEPDVEIVDAVKKLPQQILMPPVFIGLLVVSQFVMGAGALLFGRISARRSNVSLGERLGLSWPKATPIDLVAFAVASWLPLAISVAAVVLIELAIPADDSVLALYENASGYWGVLLIISIGVFPGVCEELFFRGYFQRRMLSRYHPATAIAITSVVFGIFHITPHAVALATIIGVWLGILAWRTNSIWPGAICHAFINSTWNIYQFGRHQWGIPDVPPIWVWAIGITIVAIAMAYSIIALRRLKPNENLDV